MKIRIINKVIKIRPYSFLFDLIWICRIFIPAILIAVGFFGFLWILG